MNVSFLENEEFSSGYLYQWDLNQELIISGLTFDEAPALHFCNKKSKESYYIKSELKDGNVVCQVPNVLLKEAYPIVAYLVEFDQDNNIETTLYRVDINVRERIRPSDYIFNDNVPIKGFETIEAYIDSRFEEQMIYIDERFDQLEQELIRRMLIDEDLLRLNLIKIYGMEVY